MQVTDDLIRNVVQEVLVARMRNGHCQPPTNGKAHHWGVFQRRRKRRRRRDQAPSANSSGAASTIAARPSPASASICTEQAEALGREELEETKIGRLDHKIEKLKVVADRIPGVEFLRTEAFSGENGVSLQEYRPVRRHRRHHAGHAFAADAGLQRHQHAGRRQCAGLQSASVRARRSPARAPTCSTRRFTTPSASTT